MKMSRLELFWWHCRWELADWLELISKRVRYSPHTRAKAAEAFVKNNCHKK